MVFAQPEAPSDATGLPTVCVLCSHNCGIVVDVAEGRISKVRPDRSNPITQGYTCHKAQRVGHYAEHAQRVEQPLERQPDGSFLPVSWDDAISRIAARLGAVKADHGGTAIALLGVGGQANHLDGPYALTLMRALGSRWWFNALAQEKTQHALTDRWMFDAPATVFLHADAEHSDFVLMIGTNPMLSNRGRRAPLLIKEIVTDPARTLVVVDPRVTETARRADVHLQLRPGSDALLLLGMIQHLLQHDRVDPAPQGPLRGLDALRELISEADPAELARRCGLEPKQLTDVADAFASAGRASIFVDLGLEQSRHSTLTAYLMRVLLALTGNLGVKGGNTWLGTFASEMPIADSPLPRAPVSGIEAIPMWAPFGMFSPNLFAEEVLSDGEDRIRAAIVEGSNPMIQFADTPSVRRALEALDLLVVIDPAFSETAHFADYVLPTPVGYEKWEYAGFPKGFPEIHAQVRPPVLRPPAGALPEPEIYHRLALALGVATPAPAWAHKLGARHASSVGGPMLLGALVAAAALRDRDLDVLQARLLFWLYEVVGPHLKSPGLVFLWFTCLSYAVTNRRDIQRSHPEARFWNPARLGQWLFDELMAHPEGLEVARLDASTNLTDNLRTSDGRIVLDVPQMFDELRSILAAPADEVDVDFPLVLNGGMRTRWNANTIQRDPAWRKGAGPHCTVRVHPDDASARGLQDGASVTVHTRTGAVTLPLELDATSRPGHVHIPNGFGLAYPDPVTGELKVTGVNINELTEAAARDPYTGCPHHKLVLCQVGPA